jgi:hypothetical protein
LAEHRLTNWLTVHFPPTQRIEKLLSLGLIFILLLTAIFSLSNTFWGPDWDSLWRCAFLGLMLGWMLGISRQPVYRMIIIIALGCFVYVMLFPGGLNKQAGSVLAKFVHLLPSLVSSRKSGFEDVKPLVVALQELLLATRTVLCQVWTWFEALSTNPSAFDPLAAGLFWDALIWLASAWAGWLVATRKSALLAAFPAFMLCVGALAISQRVTLIIYVALSTTLLLQATVELDRRKQTWDRLGVAYPRHKGRQIANAALIVTFGLVFLSAILSSLSFQRIWKRVPVQNTTSTQDNQNIQATIVEKTTPNAYQPLQGAGLPRDHVIATGPGTSEKVVMTVSIGDKTTFSQEVQSPPLFWRSATYDVYTGHGWSTGATESRSYLANQPIQADHATGSILVEQDVFPLENLDGIIYAAGEPVTISLPSEAAWRSSGDLFGLRTMRPSNYRVFSLVPIADITTLRKTIQDYPDWIRQNLLALPPGIPTRVKDLAVRLAASQPTVFDQALAIENYLRTYPYTVDVPYPPKQQDVVDYFLFDLKKGYCDYYASAMVVLAREIGIPARLAVGYASGSYNDNSKRFVVTEADAHSWVEVFFPGVGWVPFEPTAASHQIERSEQVVSGGAQSQNLPGGVINGQRTNLLSSSWPFLIGVIILATITGLILIIAGEIHLRRLPEASVAVHLYHWLKWYGSRLGIEVEPGVTPYELATSLQMGLERLMDGAKGISSIRRINESIQALVDGIVWISYCPTSHQNTGLLRRWYDLRWRLSAVWLLKIWYGILDHLESKGISAGIYQKLE